MTRVTPWLLAAALLLTFGYLVVESEPNHSLPEEAAPPAPEAATAPGAKARRAAIPAPRGRRAGASVPTLTVIEGAPEVDDDDEAEEPGGGVDPNLPLTPQSLMTVADRMRPSIAACVEAWTAEFPALRGEVVLGFQLDADGVAEAWVVEQEAVPPAVLGCFSAAVYEQDWPAAPDGVEVTFPFTVEAGLVDDPDDGPPLDRRAEAEADPP